MYDVAGFKLRKPEPRDVDELYGFRNDPEVRSLLRGFSTGYSKANLLRWVESHGAATDEVLFIVADENDRAIGHVALYKIDYRVRSAEFGIAIGDRTVWGRGVGRALTRFVVEYGFDELNLRRISLDVLATNERAIGLYHSLGFVDEGRLRQAQYRQGRYLDVLVMGLLAEEYARGAP